MGIKIMDNTTKYLLIQEAKLEALTRSMKMILPNIVTTISSGNINRMKSLSRLLPKPRDVRFIKQDAIRRIPKFKENYKIAKREAERNKDFNGYTSEAVAIAVGLAAGVTNQNPKDIIRKCNEQVKRVSFFPMSGMVMDLIKLTLFIGFVAAVILTGGSILIPTFKMVAYVITLLFTMISKLINAILAIGLNPDVNAKDVAHDYTVKAGEKVTGYVKDTITNTVKDTMKPDNWFSKTPKEKELELKDADPLNMLKPSHTTFDDVNKMLAPSHRSPNDVDPIDVFMGPPDMGPMW